ncbi:TPA: hypothetical protein N0F65_005636 [Lagenidium giganteum]|uniref:Glycosyltransferase family 71 protein n=1 Tax=Lagenidium giganteum TaxID=4803 RepID=A0AAV2YVZ1_9STRA|nr:TPA: hypothetical protein N0F65_005636 [Lagenidium giganteum]
MTFGNAVRGMQMLLPATSEVNDKDSFEWLKIESLADAEGYECVGWHSTQDCTPDGVRTPKRDRLCNAPVERNSAGYCVVRHNTTGELRRVFPLHCKSLRSDVKLYCRDFASMLEVQVKAANHTPVVPLVFEQCQRQLLTENNLDAATTAIDFSRGVIYSIHPGVCTASTHPFAGFATSGALVNLPGVYLREVKDTRATDYNTKLYATFYTAFDNVLLLDADNFAVQDPTYLFSTPQFNSTGAMFWPDFWRPNRTNMDMTNVSLVWDLLGIPFVDMFEQESGQVLINRRAHTRALNTLLYYGLVEPRWPQKLRAVFGDKDLFRFAWMKTNSSFHFIERPAGSAGMMAKSSSTQTQPDRFCGQTMVQHDPKGEIVFLHRNAYKMTSKKRKRIWMYVQQYKRDQPPGLYDVWGVVDKDRFPTANKCWTKYANFTHRYAVTPVASLPFRTMEERLFEYVNEAEDIVASAVRSA